MVLPPELLRVIFEKLEYSRRDLCALASTSKTFHGEAIRLLYRTVDDLSERAQNEFLSTLRHSPQLAQLVCAFRISAWRLGEGEITWRLVKPALMLMSSLKQLTCDKIIPQGEIPFQLDTFILTTDNFNGIAPSQITEFLNTQHNIKSLRWDSSCDPPELPWAQHLRTFDGPTNTIHKILPGRSVTELYVRTRWLPNSNIPTYSSIVQMKEFSKLHGLSITVIALLVISTGRAISNIDEPRPTFDRINVLEIRSARRNEINIAQLTLSIKLFPCLSKLVIRPSTSDEYLKQPYPEKSVLPLYHQCAKLIHVDIWIHGTYYQRWEHKTLLPGFLVVPDGLTLAEG